MDMSRVAWACARVMSWAADERQVSESERTWLGWVGSSGSLPKQQLNERHQKRSLLRARCFAVKETHLLGASLQEY